MNCTESLKSKLSGDTFKIAVTTVICVVAITFIVLGILHKVGNANMTAIVTGSFVTAAALYILYHLLQKSPEEVTESSSFFEHPPQDPTPPIFETITDNPETFQILETQEFMDTAVVGDKELSDSEWLSDQHIYKYFEYLDLNPDFSSLVIPNVEMFAGYISIDRHYKELTKALTEDKRQIVFPFHMSNNHWTLIFIDRVKRTVEYYDSKVNYGNYERIEERLIKMTEDLSLLDAGEAYRYERKIHKRLQPDSYECGIWILYFMEKRLQNPDIDFNQIHTKDAKEIIVRFRRHVRDQISNMSLAFKKADIIEETRFQNRYKDNAASQWRAQFFAKYPEDYTPAGDLIRRAVPRKRWQDILAGRLLAPVN